MSDYYGGADLADWLAEEVFSVDKVPPEVVALFEQWRESVEYNIEQWMDSDDGEGRRSWRGWGRGFYAIPDDQQALFDAAIAEGKRLMLGEPSKGTQMVHAHRAELNAMTPDDRDYYQDLGMHMVYARWFPIDTAPKDGRFILLAGPSGYSTTPLRVAVARWYPEYRPLNPWQTHSNDAFTDGGAEPTHWMPLPSP